MNAIAPGVFRTALNEGLLDGTDRGRELLTRTPMRRFGQPEEVAGAAVFLASDAARGMTYSNDRNTAATCSGVSPRLFMFL